jgi:hypothetical protein
MEHKLSKQSQSIKLPKQELIRTFTIPKYPINNDVNFDKVYYQNIILKNESNPISTKDKSINIGTYDALKINK